MRTLLVLCSVCCLVSGALGQYWAGPFQLSSDTFADINPSTCREWVNGSATRLVWQSNRNGDWDIYSRLCHFYNGNGWEAEMPVCTDSGDDITPTIATHFEVMGGWLYWCVWERRESPTAGRIMAATADAYDSAWSAPVEIGRCLHTSGDSARPFVMAIEHESADTLWAAWTEHDTDGWSIRYSYCTNATWTAPAVAYASANPIRHARLGRGLYVGAAYPLLAWEAGGDIWYGGYVSGAWSPAAQNRSPALDRNPEVISLSRFPWDIGPAIVWESTEDGDTAIFGAHGPGFDTVSRWCNAAPAGDNYAPGGTPTMYTALGNPYWALPVWVSDRNGNLDIYSRLMWSEDDYVDNDPGADINPTLTTIGLTQNWCIWQSNRSGNWDIYASYIYSTGVEETPSARVQTRNGGPTILSSSSVQSLESKILFDAMGRRVQAPKPGVYFVHERSAISVRKVVVTR
jgi:hypothetical protein